MNKKATLLHWILFGVLGAIGLFLFLTGALKVAQEQKGTWQVNFIYDIVQPAEIDLLELDTLARSTGQEVAAELADKGGFLKESECGQTAGMNLWNKKEQWCFPEVVSSVPSLFKEKFAQKKPDKFFSEIKMTGTHLIGKDGTAKSKTWADYFYWREYNYLYSFNVDLGYSFEEYQQLAAEAKSLVEGCRNQKNLVICLENKKPSYWKYTSCEPGKESYPVDTRQWSFCVFSPQGVQAVFPVVKYYSLALDFAPTEPFPVEEVQAKYDPTKDAYEISFEKDSLAENYALYYTNWPGVEGKSGEMAEIFTDMPKEASFGFFQKKVSLENLAQENCPTTKEKGKTYLCGTKIIYQLQDAQLVSGEKYFFTVTALREGKESLVEEFVKQ